jgi:hypothetical protein
MDRLNVHKTRYEVTTYDLREITTRTMTRDQIAELEYRRYDHFMSGVLGVWGYHTAEGEWIEHTNGDWPGIGNTCIKMIQALQLHPGEFLIPAEIAELTACDTLRGDNALSARLKAIREAHRETFQGPHFFLSKRAHGFGVAWNGQKTWMWVERLPTLSPRQDAP